MQLFNRAKKTVGVDIGTSTLVLAELEAETQGYKLLNLAHTDIPPEVFSNQLIARPDLLSEVITTLLESLSISGKDIVLNLPGPSVFTKKIRMPFQPDDELRQSVGLEAANFIPQDINQVSLDYHVLGSAGKNAIDVLLVAVKQDVLTSYIAPFEMAGLNVAVADVDYFALQNCFEMNYPEQKEHTCLLLDIGARFAGLSVVHQEQNLFCGDVTLGGRNVTDKIAQQFSLTSAQAETAKRDLSDVAIRDAVVQQMENTVSELSRQLTFFWDASAEDKRLEKIYLCGGGSLLPGFANELSERMGVEALALDCFKRISYSTDQFDESLISDLRPFASIAIGLASRRAGDREVFDN
jgi:type IV pilus assembly protein PilM